MRPGPYSTDWESILIRCVLNQPDSPSSLRAAAIGRPEWFLSPVCRSIWDGIQTCMKRSGSFSWVGVLNAVKRSGASDLITSGVEALVNEPYSDHPGKAETALEAVREAWVRREGLNRVERLKTALEDMTQTLPEVMGEVRDAYETLTAADAADIQSETFEEEAERFLAGQPVHAQVERRRMVRFGIPDLDDELLSGPGSLGIMAAKTSAGKTSLAVQSLLFTLRSGHRPMIVSLEMDNEEIATRLFACASGLTAGQVGYRGTNPSDIRWPDALNEARNIRRISRVACRKFDTIAHAIRREVIKHKIDTVFVDYFTLINPPDTASRANTAYMLGEMSKGFKALAVELGVSVVIISQFNREAKDGERPGLENLRETGQLEQDANWVLLLWTEKARYEPGEERIVLMELAKNRGGRRWVKARTRFSPDTCVFVQDYRETDPPTTNPLPWEPRR